MRIAKFRRLGTREVFRNVLMDRGETGHLRLAQLLEQPNLLWADALAVPLERTVMAERPICPFF